MALLGDPRNDENIIVSQLHGAFIAFHNRTVDILVERGFGRQREHYCHHDARCSTAELADALSDKHKAKIFEAARDHDIRYYRRLIVEDFLPRLIGPRHTASLLNVDAISSSRRLPGEGGQVGDIDSGGVRRRGVPLRSQPGS